MAFIVPYESSAGNDVPVVGEDVLWEARDIRGEEADGGVTHPPKGEGHPIPLFDKSLCDFARSEDAACLFEQHLRQVQYSLSQSVA